MADISTEEAIKKLIADDYIAGLVSGMTTIIHSQQRKIGFLEGLLAAVAVILAYTWYDLNEQLEILRLQLEMIK